MHTIELITKQENDIFKEITSGKYRDCYLIYNRKSTDEPENQKNSLKYQKSENVRFAYRQHLKIAQLTLPSFCLDGVISEKHSGFKEDSALIFGKDGTIQYRIDRPKFYQLVQFLNKGYFKGVIFLSWDRASRNKGDNHIIDKLMKQGLDFQFTLASYDKTSAGALHMDIDGMFAEHNSRVTREKVTLTIRNKRAQGICTYKAPVGYLNLGQMDNKPFDPNRAPIIVKLFELYVTGEWSLSALARWATAQGFTMSPSRRQRTLEERMAEEEDEIQIKLEPICRPPTTTNIHGILTNRFYIGEIKGNDRTYVPSASHKPLIPKELFDRVQRMLNKKNVSIHYTKTLDYPMRGIVRCGQCTRLYTPYIKKGMVYFGARCAKGCENTRKSINMTLLAGKVGKHVGELSFTDLEKREIDARENTDLAVYENRRKSQSEVNERKGKKLREDLEYLKDNKLTLLKAGVYTPESIVLAEESLNQELAAIENGNPVSAAIIHEAVADIINLSELLKNLYMYYEDGIPRQKDRIIRMLFSELTLNDNSLNYKCQKGFESLANRFIVVCDQTTWLSELVNNISFVSESISEIESFLKFTDDVNISPPQ